MVLSNHSIYTPGKFHLVFWLLVSAKFNLPNGADVYLKDSSGVDVDADIFDELLRSATVSLKAFIKNSGKNHCISFFYRVFASVFSNKYICQ